MKYHITYKRYHASSVRPDVSGYIFTFRKVEHSFSPNRTDFVKPTLSDARGAPRNAVTIVGVVVVGVTVVVDISKIGRGRGQRRSTKVQANSRNQYSTQPI